MIPTPKLRFVERFKPYPEDKETVRILQQWWYATLPYEESEWRDVPIEQEQA